MEHNQWSPSMASFMMNQVNFPQNYAPYPSYMAATPIVSGSPFRLFSTMVGAGPTMSYPQNMAPIPASGMCVPGFFSPNIFTGYGNAISGAGPSFPPNVSPMIRNTMPRSMSFSSTMPSTIPVYSGQPYMDSVNLHNDNVRRLSDFTQNQSQHQARHLCTNDILDQGRYFNQAANQTYHKTLQLNQERLMSGLAPSFEQVTNVPRAAQASDIISPSPPYFCNDPNFLSCSRNQFNQDGCGANNLPASAGRADTCHLCNFKT